MVRTFKKPTLTKNKPLEVNTEHNTPLPTRFMKGMPDVPKEQTEREKYLARLNVQIYEKEREWESICAAFEVNKTAIDATFTKHTESLTQQLKEMESILALKRAERTELEKPVLDRIKVLNTREEAISAREQELPAKEQAIFERERACESKLDSVKDLSDELSEMRLRLSIREKKLETKEKTLAQREVAYLVAIQNLKEQEASVRNAFQEREYAVALKELGVQSKEENLIVREHKLLEGNLRLTDQRGVLERAWKEVEHKKHG